MTGKRRVLQVLGRSAGGVGRHVAEVVRALDGPDLAVDVAAPRDLRIEMPKEVIPVEIPDGPVRGHFQAIRTLRRLVASKEYDLVHAHGLRASLDATVAARLAHVPAVITLHNLLIDEVSGGIRAAIYRRAEPLAVRLSAHTFVPSREIAERLAEAAPRAAGKIEVLYAGTAPPPVLRRSAEEVRLELGLDNQSLIVTVARLHPQKDLSTMLGALQGMDDSAVLAVIGEGPLEQELKEEARSRGIDKRVRWLGFRSDVADIIAAADVFALSSLWEAVPLAAQEAVQLGTAVVATDVGGLDELIADGSSGRLVPKGDEVALASALREALESTDARTRWADRARVDFGTRFSRDAIIARLKEVYTSGVA